jgi:hypothetical protein
MGDGFGGESAARGLRRVGLARRVSATTGLSGWVGVSRRAEHEHRDEADKYCRDWVEVRERCLQPHEPVVGRLPDFRQRQLES